MSIFLAPLPSLQQKLTLRHRRVNPLYYVTFTTFTLVASFILFRGFNTTSAVNTISLLCGFLTIFTGVYLLNLSREDPDGEHLGIRSKGGYQSVSVDGIPAAGDGIAGLATRMSMQTRRSGEEERERHRRSGSWSLRSPVVGRQGGGDLMHSYDVEADGGGLGDLAEDSDEDTSSSGRKRTSFEELGARAPLRSNGAATAVRGKGFDRGRQ